MTESSVNKDANAMYADTQTMSYSVHRNAAIEGANAPPAIAPNW